MPQAISKQTGERMEPNAIEDFKIVLVIMWEMEKQSRVGKLCASCRCHLETSLENNRQSRSPHHPFRVSEEPDGIN
jgi:hypothetical protein